MTTKEKTKLIQDTIDVLNNTFLKPMKAKIAFEVQGQNKYALVLRYRKSNLKDYGQVFYTYDDVLGALRFLTDITDRYLKEHKK